MPRDTPETIVRNRTATRGVLCAALAFGVLISEAAAAAEYTLERVVLVSRHGVRAPTAPKDPSLSDVASRPWPTWIVNAPADLTPRGEELVSLMGGYYRQYFAAQGVLPADGCPPKDHAPIYVWADVDQRTLRTGDALLAGAFSSCGLYANHLEPTTQTDPLFHPLRAGVCTIEQRDWPAIRKKIEDDLHAAGKTKEYGDTVRGLQNVLGCCKPQVCNSQGTCTLGNASASVTVKGDGATLNGPVSIGSITSEIFLLEYAQGMPSEQVGWGRASKPEQIVPLLKMHALQFNLIDRPRHLATPQASALVHQVLATLRQAAKKDPGPMQPVPPEAKVVIYVGHDTNLANIGGMLGLHWQLKGYLLDETPPAGAMAFELLREKGADNYVVRLAYYSQTLDQMRNATRLTLASRLDRAGIALQSFCHPIKYNNDDICPWPEFDAKAAALVDSKCVATK